MFQVLSRILHAGGDGGAWKWKRRLTLGTALLLICQPVAHGQEDCVVVERFSTGTFALETDSVLVGDGFVLFGVREVVAGRDLNRDGRIRDDVYHIYDVVRQEVVNLELAYDLTDNYRMPAVISGRMAVLVANERLNGRDLNGNGSDYDGAVYFAYDVDHSSLSQLAGFAFSDPVSSRAEPLVFEQGWAFCIVDEIGTQVDFNGDGRIEARRYVGGYHVESKRKIELPWWDRLEAQQGRVLMPAWEYQLHPPTDVNGDGDLEDVIPRFFDLETECVDTLPTAGSVLTFSSSLAVVSVQERDEGRDLNGDGDLEDVLLGLWDFDRGELSPKTIEWTPYVALRGRQMLWRESPGEASEPLWNVYDIDTAEQRTIESITGYLSSIREDGAILYVQEALLEEDVTGDGDQKDYLLAQLDVDEDRYWSLWPCWWQWADWGTHLLVSAEESLAELDLNGDGDTRDNVLMIWDTRAHELTSYGLSIIGIMTDERGATFGIPEDGNRRDLDGDGVISKKRVLGHISAVDRVLRIIPTEEQYPSFEASGSSIALRIQEHGVRDLNENGSKYDAFLDLLEVSDLAWEAKGVSRSGGKLFFEARGLSSYSGQHAAVLISLGDGVDSGGVPLPGSNGLRLGLDADALLSTWLTLPMPLRQVRLAGCQSIATAELPLPGDLPTGVRVFYAGYSFEGAVITAVSGTRSFALE